MTLTEFLLILGFLTIAGLTAYSQLTPQVDQWFSNLVINHD